jgi:hypothetical protein
MNHFSERKNMKKGFFIYIIMLSCINYSLHANLEKRIQEFPDLLKKYIFLEKNKINIQDSISQEQIDLFKKVNFAKANIISRFELPLVRNNAILDLETECKNKKDIIKYASDPENLLKKLVLSQVDKEIIATFATALAKKENFESLRELAKRILKLSKEEKQTIKKLHNFFFEIYNIISKVNKCFAESIITAYEKEEKKEKVNSIYI